MPPATSGWAANQAAALTGSVKKFNTPQQRSAAGWTASAGALGWQQSPSGLVIAPSTTTAEFGLQRARPLWTVTVIGWP